MPKANTASSKEKNNNLMMWQGRGFKAPMGAASVLQKKELPSLTALYLRSGNQGLVLPYDVHLLGKPERSAVMMKSLALEVQGKDLTNHLENQPSVEPMAGEKEKNLPRSSASRLISCVEASISESVIA